ncbi:methyl-accepting chemotaxis protein [Agrobacterium tumefaciens]|uniref:methyl-accepting chemotaxis protein n=1 Tax=Agrobacterium tumefaciens TaxID=358 RepID=UPI003013F33F
MRSLADGDSATCIPFSERTDEIGDMAGAVEVFRRNAAENARLEKEAADARDEIEHEREGQAHERALRAQSMERASNGLGEGLRHLSDGDLEFRLVKIFAPDFVIRGRISILPRTHLGRPFSTSPGQPGLSMAGPPRSARAWTICPNEPNSRPLPSKRRLRRSIRSPPT